MHGPKCDQKLFIEQYNTVEVNFCGGCTGAWLDTNELDQVLAAKEHTGPLRKFLKVLGA